MSSRRQVKSSGRTVLVVDDQVETLSSVRMLLEREGHRVLTAESGPQALELLAHEPVQLLLVDYFMPVMNGEELMMGGDIAVESAPGTGSTFTVLLPVDCPRAGVARDEAAA